ncbi:hypothetical protein NECAME_09315 [Necator americanus]|uniref:Uncharacterized protein n=1 Tax=Necator americanus TaxID=51031 RepID=W2TDT9_NECAM|nr:hypothetical protein NECAME_09315 [Necator americanus]ETN80220.1 hypothetical protein NECAME_09315 [Necator americanus]
MNVCESPKYSYLFYGDKVYSILDDRVVSSHKIADLFPSGPNSVNAAVFDEDNGIFVLIHERSVYGYKYMGTASMVLDSSYPKGLPDNVRGISKWEHGHANVYTKNLVFSYNSADKSVVGDGVPVPRFLRC